MAGHIILICLCIHMHMNKNSISTSNSNRCNSGNDNDFFCSSRMPRIPALCLSFRDSAPLAILGLALLARGPKKLGAM